MSFTKAAQFMSRNRQPLMNCLGMGIIFSYSVHNYRLKIAWDEHELEMRMIEAESERIKTTLLDETWVKEAGERLRWGKSTLAKELEERLAVPVETTPMDRVLEQQKELDLIAKELGVGVSKDGSDGVKIV